MCLVGFMQRDANFNQEAKESNINEQLLGCVNKQLTIYMIGQSVLVMSNREVLFVLNYSYS